MSRWTRVATKSMLVCVLVSSLILVRWPVATNLYINSLIREINKRGLVWWHQYRGMESASGEHFVVFHADGQRQAAALILNAAEDFYPALAESFGFHISGPVPVLLYNDRESLNRSFGWPTDADTMGVYWAGSIRVLSPDAWIDPADGDYARTFRDLGPMAHEITHLFVDHLSRGNCPRWFNEGVAQYQEYVLTGFRFGEERSFPLGRSYTFAELAEFDSLEEQHLAYHQSFSIVAFLVDRYGWPQVVRVLEAFGRGAALEEALAQVLGIDLNTLDGEWKSWVAYR